MAHGLERHIYPLLRILQGFGLCLLLAQPLILRATPYEVDLTSWADDFLFDRAIRAYHTGDCQWALKAYRVLLSRRLEPEMQANALYNQAICLEKGQFWEDAAETYQTLVQSQPHAPLARDALFRLGVLSEVQGEPAQAYHYFKRLNRQRWRMPPRDRRAITVELAWQELELGKLRRAARRLRKVQKQWDRLPADEAESQAFFKGKAHVAAGRILAQYGWATDVHRPRFAACLPALLGASRAREACEKVQRTQLEARLQAARFQFEQAIDQGSAIWISAACFLMGENLERYYTLLNGSPAPDHLTEKQARIFNKLRAQRTKELLLDASRIYNRGLWTARQEGDTSGWTQGLEAKVAVISSLGVEGLVTSAGTIHLKGDLGGRRLE